MKNPGRHDGCRRVVKAGVNGARRRLNSKHGKPSSNCLIAEKEAQFKRVAKVGLRRGMEVGRADR